MNVAVVTTLNEQETIGQLLTALFKQGLPVVMVDDCSTDDTVHLANHMGASVISTAERQGIGPCLMVGWKRALQMGAERIVQIDAGGSHDPAEIRRLLEVEADVVIGSRFASGAVYTGRPRRAFMSKLAALACNLKKGFWIADWTSGYRVFTADAALVLMGQRYTARMHGWQIEVLAHALACGLTVKEAPIHYLAGRSSFGRKVAMEAVRYEDCIGFYFSKLCQLCRPLLDAGDGVAPGIDLAR